MFKYFLISITIIPLLVGIGAARGEIPRQHSALRIGWVVYAVLWFGVLYYLRFRWS